jgi:hypothetical protein
MIIPRVIGPSFTNCETKPTTPHPKPYDWAMFKTVLSVFKKTSSFEAIPLPLKNGAYSEKMCFVYPINPSDQ